MKSWAHQTEGAIQALQGLGEHGGFGLWWGMGTGKTRTALRVAASMQAQRVLVVCPKSVMPVWKGEVEKHGFDFGVHLISGNPLRREKTLTAMSASGGPTVAVINYEAAWRTKGLLSRPWDLVIWDEAHRLKQPGGRASRWAGRFAAAVPFRLGLSGTPVPHSPLDAWAVYRAITPTDPLGFRTFTQFRARFLRQAARHEWGDNDLVFRKERGGELSRYKLRDLDLLNERMYGSPVAEGGRGVVAHRVLADDVLDLLEPIDVERVVQLEPVAAKAYRDLERDLIHQFADEAGGQLTAANALTLVLRLAQLTGGTLKDEDGVEHRMSMAKQLALSDFLEDAAPEPVVVFCRFHSDLDAVHAAALGGDTRHERVLELSGRINELAKWQAGAARVLAVQIQAGGVGIDLTRARLAVYYSLGYSLSDYLQSRARLHRPGQAGVVEYVHLIAEGTVDEDIYTALAARTEVIAAVVDRIRPAARPAPSRP